MANKVKHYKITGDPAEWDISSIYFKEKAGNKFSLIVTSDDGTPTDLDAVTPSELTTILADYVTKAGNNTFTGNNTFSNPLTVATPTADGHATTKKYVDDIESDLQDQIDALQSSLGPPVDIDCSSNPNYPSGEPGDNWIVTAAGRIGGASGPEVEVGDWIICKNTSAGGTHAAVGANYFIVQRNIGLATDTTPGIFRMATDAEAESKTGNGGFLTPGKASLLLDKASIRYDKSQSLTEPQQAQARSNIGALAAADLSNYWTKTESDGRYGQLAANNAWTMHNRFTPANTTELTPAANSVRITRAVGGSLVGLDNAAGAAGAVLRAFNGGTSNLYQLSLASGGVETGNHGNSAQWQEAYQKIVATHIGRTDNFSLVTNTDLNTPETWSALPVGWRGIISTNVGTTNGAPNNSSGYFMKIANRQSQGGWSGIWIDNSTGDLWVGRSTMSSQYATWTKLATSDGFVTVNTDQAITGVKTFENATRWTLPSNAATVAAAYSIQLGRSNDGVFFQGYDTAAGDAFLLRSFAQSGIQLTLNKGGVSTPSHGTSQDWYTASQWVANNGADVLAGMEWAQEAW